MIGLHMIAKGRPDQLINCIESQLGFADCFSIAVDSTDLETYEAARSVVGDSAYLQEWPGSFCTARNESLAHLLQHHPYVKFAYWMDADDTCHSDLPTIKQRILDIKPHLVTTKYQYTEQMSHHRVRLWRVVDGCSTRIWAGPIHEVDYEVFESDGPSLFWDDWVITHIRHEEGVLKHFRCIKIAEACLKEAPDDLRTRFYLGREYFFVRNYYDAIRCFKWYLEDAPDTTEKYQALVDLAEVYIVIKAPDKAKSFLRQAVALFPTLPYAAVRLGDAHRDECNYKGAAYWYRYAKNHQETWGVFDWEYLRTTYAQEQLKLCEAQC